MINITSWPVVSLGDLLVERKESLTQADVSSNSIPVIDKITFADGNIYIRVGRSTLTKLIRICPGDLVLSGINANRGAVAVHDSIAQFDISATIHYSAFSVNPQRADPWYIRLVLRAPTYKAILTSQLPRGVKSELKANRLFPIKIPLPPLDEQKRIVLTFLAIQQRLAEIGENLNSFSTACSNLPIALFEAELIRYPGRVPFSHYFGDVLRNGLNLSTFKFVSWHASQ